MHYLCNTGGRGREPVREWEKPLTVVVAIR